MKTYMARDETGHGADFSEQSNLRKIWMREWTFTPYEK